MSQKIVQILQFWFEKTDLNSIPNQALVMKWFRGGQEIDKQISSLFLTDLQIVAKGGYQEWKQTKDGCLAYIIIADQFARNCCHDKIPFYHVLALKTTMQVLSNQTLYQQFQPMQKHFLLLPLMHSQKIEDQKEFQSRWESVIAECKANNSKYLDFAVGVAKYGKAHLEIAEKFGRFPYQNKIMNRQSTPEQIEWLKNWKGF